MDGGYLSILASLAVGAAYGLYGSKRARALAGWLGLGVLAVLIAGLIIAGRIANESLTWFFGLALMGAAPTVLFVAIGVGIGAFFGRLKADRE